MSAWACAAPLGKAARLFEQRTGIAVEIGVCSRHCAQPVAEEAAASAFLARWSAAEARGKPSVVVSRRAVW